MILVSAYLILLGLIFWIIFGIRGKWWLKSATLIISFIFSFSLWNAFNSYKGWPVHQNIPKDSQFLSGAIDQPNAAIGDPGHIFLWLLSVQVTHNPFGYKPLSGEPRAYELPYSKGLESAINQAQNIQKQNSSQKGTIPNGVLFHRGPRGKYIARKFRSNLPPKPSSK